ncbi:S41 family peptidase [Thalassotalea profundi]|uniref:Interphotoreceptor retinoid-binding protein n=1 Tax=Thalassotalea profundi TaxID=2036687 RepID=A0ABQ3J265_9GAMM|nr:S41 family peptidase [Thalassotalea profundi]GHF00236.1 interphotoreceptor retinoid-binding protein [Thalassotalea profundi]
MKKINLLLMHVLLWLSIAFSQASELNRANLNDTLFKQNIEKAIKNIILILEKEYIYPEKALLVKAELKRKLANKEFDKVSDWYSFIRSLSVILRDISGDMYLDIVEPHPSLTLEKVKRKSALNLKDSYIIRNVDLLSGNVGYIKVNYFYQTSNAKKEIFRALKELSMVDALIIDLRDTEGDSIPLAQYLMSFFIKESTILSEVLYDQQKKKKRLRALETSGNDKFKHNFPIYILTSSYLSSSGEFFSYTLQHLKKAFIVGENTMGIAHVLQNKKINNHISLTIPIAIHLHPATHSNWEKTGVIPDLDIAANLSVDAAHKMAKQYLGIF